MAFVFNSTPKDPNANSYISVEDADSFAYGVINGQMWLDLTEQQKQSLLVQATSRLDIENWGGVPTTTTNTINTVHQALQWPRAWIVDRNYANDDIVLSNGGLMYRDPEVIPRELKQATFMLAMHYLNEFLDNPTVSRQDMDRLTSLNIGPMAMGIQARKEEEFPDLIKRLIRSIGKNAWLGNSTNVKLFR